MQQEELSRKDKQLAELLGFIRDNRGDSAPTKEKAKEKSNGKEDEEKQSGCNQ